MAGLKALNINTPPEAEPHIYAEDDAAIYKAIFGGDGVSTIGQACKATVLSNNKVRIADGVLCVDGHMARIPYGEYEDCEIMNGQSGKNRNDIIVAKFETTGTGGIDTMTCEAIQGTAGETAVDPELTQDDIYAGGKVREYPLYRVKIEGLSITAVEQMFEIIPSNKDLSKLLDYDPTEKTYFENGWTMKYRHISHNQVYVTLQNTNTGVTEAIPNNLIMAGVPLRILFAQCVPVKMVVGNSIVGYGSITFSGKGAYLQSVAYGNSASWFGYGVVIVE